jgi:hypothetical protein
MSFFMLLFFSFSTYALEPDQEANHFQENLDMLQKISKPGCKPCSVLEKKEKLVLLKRFISITQVPSTVKASAQATIRICACNVKRDNCMTAFSYEKPNQFHWRPVRCAV